MSSKRRSKREEPDPDRARPGAGDDGGAAASASPTRQPEPHGATSTCCGPRAARHCAQPRRRCRRCSTLASGVPPDDLTSSVPAVQVPTTVAKSVGREQAATATHFRVPGEGAHSDGLAVTRLDRLRRRSSTLQRRLPAEAAEGRPPGARWSRKPCCAGRPVPNMSARARVAPATSAATARRPSPSLRPWTGALQIMSATKDLASPVIGTRTHSRSPVVHNHWPESTDRPVTCCRSSPIGCRGAEALVALAFAASTLPRRTSRP